MKKFAVVAACALSLGLAGCGRDWFGNEPSPTPKTETPQACSAPTVPAPNYGQVPGRPAEVPPGWRWVYIELEVRALKANDNLQDWCVPFALHVHGTGPAGAPVLMIDSNFLPRMMPYDGQKVTPWEGAHFIFAYDPGSPRFPVPPEYFIDLIATYLPERDVFGEGPIAAFRCAIRINGAPVVQQIAVAGSPMTTRCQLRVNQYSA